MIMGRTDSIEPIYPSQGSWYPIPDTQSASFQPEIFLNYVAIGIGYFVIFDYRKKIALDNEGFSSRIVVLDGFSTIGGLYSFMDPPGSGTDVPMTKVPLGDKDLELLTVWMVSRLQKFDVFGYTPKQALEVYKRCFMKHINRAKVSASTILRLRNHVQKTIDDF